MKYKFKPLMLGIAVSAAITGCGSEQPQPEITNIFDEVGLWCKSPDLVQVASADFYPLSIDEQAALDAEKAAVKAQAEADDGGDWTAEEEAAWEASFKYDDLDLYTILGLTIEETERQAIAKEEARVFQVSQGQDVIRGEDFDTWFETWFEEIPPANYLGPSQRINRSVNATTAEMDGTEICYTPPLSCPNYKAIDESGTYECIIPEQNPIADAPAPEVVAGANEAIAFYRHEDHVDGGDNTALYETMVVHTWNNSDCTAYQDDTLSNWGANSTYAQDNNGIDANYGMYWKLHLLDDATECANVIFNDTANGKKISDSDLMMPIGASGNVVLHNLDKNAYSDDNFPVNVLDGMLLINQHPYFGAEASSGLKACGWSMEADESGEQCLGQVLECPTGNVAVGVGAVDIASKCVAIFDPEVTDLLLRGGFNGWGSDEDPNFEASQLSYANGQYQVNYSYTSDCVVVEPVEATDDVEAVEGEDCVDSYDFKVADLGWSEPATFGSIKGGDQSSVGATILMTVGSGVGQNMKVDFAKDEIYQFLVNATDPEAVMLTINEVPVNAFPMLTIGAEVVAVKYSNNGLYVVRMDLAAEEHTFTLGDESTGFAVGAIGTDNVIVNNTPLALVADGGSLSFTASAAAEYDFILDLSDPASPTIEIKPALPFATDSVFIRGTVTGWGDPAPDADEVLWNGDDRTYSVIYGLEADVEQQFKFASQAWDGSKYDIGGGNADFSEEGLTLTGDGNIAVTPTKSTSYKFSISYATADPVIKVEEAPLYLRGGITGSGWGADDGNQFEFVPETPGDSSSASHVYSLEVNYDGGAAIFKVADGDWGGALGYNYGASADDVSVELGVALELYSANSDEDIGDSKNINIDVPAGTYIFSFEDGVTKTMTVTAK